MIIKFYLTNNILHTMHAIIDMIKDFLGQIGYTEIFIMMVLESSFFPFPSEVAMIPAGYLASIWKLDFSMALIVWTFWATIWATINYFLGFYLWWTVIKTLIWKYGKFFLITEAHYEKTEKYFEKHGIITTFLARFVTVIRQLISLPAWVFKMNFSKFLFYTSLGAGLWNLALMLIGYVWWKNSELIAQYSKQLLFWWFLLFVCIGIIYYLINRHKNNKNHIN